MKVFVVGTGYVGLVTGACFAEMGHIVTCYDINQEKILKLQDGIIPIYEPGLEEIVRRNTQAKRLSFTTDIASCDAHSVCILAVDTPLAPNGSCDTTAIKNASIAIAQEISSYKVIINKSTVPVGTSKFVQKTIQEVLERRGVFCSFDVVSNPEFLKEGAAVSDFMRPDRVIVGASSERAKKIMQELYKPFMLSSDRLYFMSPESAELTKYAANTMLALRISFMNWLSNLAEQSGADILDIRKGIGSDKRIGNAFLWAGIGYGGSCLPKDIQALQAMGEQFGLDSSLIKAIDSVNERQKSVLFEKMLTYFSDRSGIQGKTIGIFGLSFKPDTDDMRKAPSLVLIQKLVEHGAFVRVFDPVAMENAKKEINHPNITWCKQEQEVAFCAHALALVTEWKQFRLMDVKSLLKTMKGNAFFDGRNQYDPHEMAKQGFNYFSIGRASTFSALEQDFVTAPEARLNYATDV